MGSGSGIDLTLDVQHILNQPWHREPCVQLATTQDEYQKYIEKRRSPLDVCQSHCGVADSIQISSKA